MHGLDEPVGRDGGGRGRGIGADGGDTSGRGDGGGGESGGTLLRAALLACTLAAAIQALPTASRPIAAAFATLALAISLTLSTSLSIAARPRAVILAFPALLAVLVPTSGTDRPLTEGELPRAGPVTLVGRVVGRVDRDARAGEVSTVVELDTGGVVRLRVEGRPDRLPHLAPGDRLEVFGALRAPTARLRQDRLAVVAAAPAGVQVRGPAVHGVAHRATHVRLHLQENLRAAIPGPAGDLMCHLVLGSGPRLDDRTVEAHRATGLTHLLAVSGAHATMLAWMLSVAWSRLSPRAGWTSASWRIGCAAILFAYGAITGFEPPVVRALIAALVILHAAAGGRRLEPWTALAAPALWTAWFRPTDLTSASFCLSYAAVAGLALAGGIPSRGAGPTELVVAALRGSVGAVIATAPWTLAFFGQIAPSTVLLTPLLAPVVALLLGAGIVAALLGDLLPAVAQVIGTWAIAPVVNAYTWIVETADVWLPWTPLFAHTRGSATAALGCAVLASVAALAARPATRWALGRCRTEWARRAQDGLRRAGDRATGRDRLRSLGAWACCGAVLPWFAGVGASPQFGLELLAVGHGQAAVIRPSDGSTVLVDCGSRGTGWRSAAAVDAALTDRRIDVLVLSHSDADHTNGVPSLLARMPPPHTTVAPASMRHHPHIEQLARAGTRLHFVTPGQRHTIGRVEILAPPLRPELASANECSLWVRVDLGDALGRVLVTGDAGPAAVAAMTAGARRPADATDRDDESTGRGPLTADVLVLPHHGRGLPTTLATLLHAVQPTIALASNAEDEADPPLVVAARRSGLVVRTTGEHGTIHWSRPDTSRIPRLIHEVPASPRIAAPPTPTPLAR